MASSSMTSFDRRRPICGRAVGIDLGDEQIVADAAVDDDLVAERLDELDLAR